MVIKEEKFIEVSLLGLGLLIKTDGQWSRTWTYL
jgi:hypothetical protein